jgi:DNA repair exonuclease SbcCD nuclease subunit
MSLKIKGKKIGCFSDIHIGLGQDSKIWHDISLNFAKWASEKYLNSGINDIIIPGDIFHNRNEIGVETLAVAKKFFDYFKDFNIYISSGNHDCFYKNNSTINSISILDGWNNITIIDNVPTTIKTDYNDIVLIPWGTEYENIPKTEGIIFGHFEINSFYMNSYKVCEHGMDSKDLFNKSQMIVSGHFHKKDHRRYGKGQIVYLGSPYQHNFGDINDDRGIYILNLENNEFEFINNDISPKHLKLSAKEFIKNPESIDSDMLKGNVNGNIISLVVDDKIEHEKLAIMTSNIQNMSPISLRIDYLDSDNDISQTDDNKDFDSGNILKDIEEFVNNLNINNKPEVIEYLTETYNLLTK